ncbi:MAG: type II secretion system protein GspG [Planctomycetota bacterium]
MAATLIVLSILVMLSIASRPWLHSPDEPRAMKAQTDVDMVAAAVRRFEKRNDTLPTLEQLTVPDEHGRQLLEDLCEDPWGNAYELRTCPPPRRFEVISAGPDGELDTGDDIRSRPSTRR